MAGKDFLPSRYKWKKKRKKKNRLQREIQPIAARKKNRVGRGIWELQTIACEKDERQDRRPGTEMEEWS